MSVAKGRSSVDYTNIKDKLSEVYLLATYLNITHIPCLIKSPFREDKHPSFSLYTHDGIHVYFKDFATGEQGNTFELFKKLWNCSYQDVLEKIETEAKPSVQISKYKKEKVTVSESVNKNIQCKIREWKPHDIQYWESYGITLDWLKKAEVYPISHYFITKDKNTYCFSAEKYAYCYVERKDGDITFKIYQPFSKQYKWTGNINRSVWSLWSKIPNFGTNLFITSSLKDALNLWANLNIPAVSLQGEGYLPKPQVIEELKGRYKNIIVFYDNDYSNPNNPGRENSNKLCSLFNLKKIEIPDKYEAKDPSDLFKKYGKEKYLEIMKELLANIKE